ncbi:myosin-J heavy chain isoform X2 [Zootoca vivipara]|uniref:myosin-J heavy chain isoform X2 n=1 Tax=Zootoca vivipara TaxID=8524 RepID=UPI00293BB712|nr:myosin-J heavy chain isoform X2 [Zootoca vivipara]
MSGGESWSKAEERRRQASPSQDQVQDTAESGSCSTANRASSQTEAGSLESQLQNLRGSLHPLASQFLQAQEVVVGIAAQLLANDQPLRSSLPAAKPSLLEANQGLRQQLSDQEELVFHLREANRKLQSSLEDQTARRLEERELREQKEKVSRLLKEKQQVQEKLKDQEKLVSELLERNGKLQQELEEKDIRVSHLVHENDWLRRENARLQRGPGSQRWTSSFWPRSTPTLTAFPVQVWTTGQTGGCEKDIVNDVSKLLEGLGISLRQEGYEEKSDHFLLLFCAVFSRVGSDILCALEALNRVRKAVLVVLHHKSKGSTQEILDTQRQV